MGEINVKCKYEKNVYKINFTVYNNIKNRKRGKNMERMKTFLTYVLLIIGFFILSVFLENGLLIAMYSSISGNLDGYYSAVNGEFEMKNITAKACNINGYINFELVNTTGSFINQCYLKIDLYNEQNLLADTEYVEIIGMQAGDSKTFNLKFKANNIERFNISVVENTPDRTNIINILGWEVDLTNVFGIGIDLSNVTIFGKKLTDLFSWSNIKSMGMNFWSWFTITAKGVPPWAYLIACMFIAGVI